MSDNLKAKKQDAKRINVHEQWELNSWSRSLGVSEAELKKAVHQVGPMVNDVKKYLGLE